MSESEHPEIQGHFHNVIKPPNPKKFKDNKIKKNRQRKYFLKIYITFSSSKSSVMLNHPKTVKCMLYPLLNLKTTYTPCTFSFISKKWDHPFKALKFNGMIIPNFEVFGCKKNTLKNRTKQKNTKNKTPFHKKPVYPKS